MVCENGQCISVQGHPEFDRDLMRRMIKTRMAHGALDKDLSERCLKQLASVSEEMEDVWLAEKILKFVVDEI